MPNPSIEENTADPGTNEVVPRVISTRSGSSSPGTGQPP